MSQVLTMMRRATTAPRQTNTPQTTIHCALSSAELGVGVSPLPLHPTGATKHSHSSTKSNTAWHRRYSTQHIRTAHAIKITMKSHDKTRYTLYMAWGKYAWTLSPRDLPIRILFKMTCRLENFEPAAHAVCRHTTNYAHSLFKQKHQPLHRL